MGKGWDEKLPDKGREGAADAPADEDDEPLREDEVGAGDSLADGAIDPSDDLPGE